MCHFILIKLIVLLTRRCENNETKEVQDDGLTRYCKFGSETMV